ncbi:MAG: PHP domain protein, partial [candidate division WWE3 bacterium GW2011_GWB1_44_4]
SDAHSTESLNLMQYGIDVARRGWLTKSSVVNTLPKSEFTQAFMRYNNRSQF